LGIKAGRSESGQVLVLVTLSLFVLIGFVALAVDIGYLYNVRRRMQTAADAAAVAGANALQGSNSANYQQAAKDVASLDGFATGSNNVTVTVGPPATPPNPTSGTYVEVDIAQAVPTFFLGVIGYSTMNVSARAVAGAINGPACIYALDPTANAALGISGSAPINSDCGVMVDSSSASALSASGSATLNAPLTGIVGDAQISGSASVNPPPKTNVASAPNPLAYLQEPTVGSCTYTGCSVSGSGNAAAACKSTTIGGVVYLNPGVYCGGISISGSSSVFFNPGTYILDGGGLNASGSTTLNGSGVVFYDTADSSHSYGPITLSGSSHANLSAPTSGPLAGILFFQDPSVKGGQGSTISGSSGSSFDGALYFPTTAVNYSGSSGASGYTIVVADTITLSGSASMTIGNNYSSLADGSPIKSSTLYE
jgi:Flp pilus assembly protein TadG